MFAHSLAGHIIFLSLYWSEKIWKIKNNLSSCSVHSQRRWLYQLYDFSPEFFLDLEKRTGIYGVHSRSMKIVLYSMEPHLKASPRHGGQGFFELFVTDPPRGRPFGGGGDHRKWRCVKKISYHNWIVQFSWEMLNYMLNAHGGFTPDVVAPPMR